MIPAGLVFLFSLGIFSLAATLVRLAMSTIFKNTKSYKENLQMQPRYSTWTQAEINIAIVCANMPALWTLAKWLIQGRSLTRPSAGSYDKYPSRPPARGKGSGGSGGSQENFGHRGAIVNAVSGGQRTSWNEKSDGITFKTEVSMDINEAGERYHNHVV